MSEATIIRALVTTLFPSGLCAQTDPELFFPEKGGSTKAAKKICMACPERIDCLEAALAGEEKFGIWGGLTERERRRILRKRKIAS
jgi:WhiB family redox-sensing transcriptional regulator